MTEQYMVLPENISIISPCEENKLKTSFLNEVLS